MVPIVQCTWHMYITKCYMHVSSEKVLTFLKRMVRSWTSFSAVSITGWFFGRPPERDLQLGFNIRRSFHLFPKKCLHATMNLSQVECVHYTYTCTWSLQNAWIRNLRYLQNVSDKIMFNTAFLKNESNVLIRTFGYKLNQGIKFKP